MLYLILFVIIFCLLLYFLIVRPYVTIISLKKQFEQKGYKVKIQPLNFSKNMIVQILQIEQKVHNDAFYRFKHQYKQYDVTIMNCFFHVYVLFNSLQLVKEAYQQIQHLEQISICRKNLQRVYGKGIQMGWDRMWRIKRKLYSQIFNFKMLEELHPVFQKSIQEQIKSWKVNTQFNLLTKFKELAFNNFVIAYFGRQFDNYSYKNQAFSQSVVKVFQTLMSQSFTLKNVLFGANFLKNSFLKQDQQIQERLTGLKNQTKQFILKRFEQILKSKESQQRSILSRLVFKVEIQSLTGKQREQMIESIVGDLIVFFFASTDSLSDTLTTTLHMLNKNPQIRAKLQVELQQAQNNCNPSTIKRLKYMDAVFNQTLRLLGPGNWILPRQIIGKAISVGEVTLPKQIQIGIQSISTHHSQKYYQNPYQYIPQRWLDKKIQNSSCFISFGGGQRNCIGQHLARIEYKIVLTKLLREYKFSTNQNLIMHAPFAYQPKYNMFVLSKKQSYQTAPQNQ